MEQNISKINANSEEQTTANQQSIMQSKYIYMYIQFLIDKFINYFIGINYSKYKKKISHCFGEL